MLLKLSRFLTCILVSLLSCGVLFSVVSLVYAQEATLYVDPPSIVNTSLVPPNTFIISVKLANVSNMYGFEFKLLWNTTILDLKKVEYFLPWSPFFLVKNETREDLGRYWIGASGLAPASPFAGSTTLARLTFKVTGIGHTALDLRDTKVGDPTAQPIPHAAQDGYFSNEPPPPPARARSLLVHPSRVVNTSLTPGTGFSIEIRVEDAFNLHSFSLILTYNTTILDVLNATVNPVFTTATTSINETGGYVLATGIDLNVSGNVTLVTTTFNVTGFGESVLDLHNDVLRDSSDAPISHATYDGYFTNILLAKLFVDPEKIVDPTLLPGDTFTIDMMVVDVLDLYDFEFNLTYDTAILNALGAVIHPFPNQTQFSSKITITDSQGFVWIYVQYYQPAVPLSTRTPFILATIYFQVQAQGETPLDLHGTQLSDALGDRIPHEAKGGLVSILKHDVAIIGISVSRTSTYAKRIIYINATAKNKGDVAESFNVTAYYNNTVIEKLLVPNLAPNTTKIITFTWNTTGVTSGKYTIKAIADIVPYELNTADNTYVDGVIQIKKLGDINGDGIVDINDVIIAGNAFGSSPGYPEWDERADLDDNGVVDIFDLIIVAINYG